MKKKITVNEFLLCYPVLEKLVEQDKCFKINTAFKLVKTHKELYDVKTYIINRIMEVLPSVMNEEATLTETESILYNSILNSVIEIDNNDITIDELVEDNKAELTVSEAEKLKCLL